MSGKGGGLEGCLWCTGTSSFSALRAVAREVEIYQPEKPARRMKAPEAQ